VDSELPASCPAVRIFRRTWTATDDCTNSASCSQTITFVDTTPPMITTCPTNQDLGSNPTNIPACNVADVVATDNCGTPTITCASFDGPVIDCVHYRTNVYSATDACHNSSTCRQVLSWTQDPPPQLTISRPVHPPNRVEICWPVTCASYVLEKTSSLNPPVQWMTVTNHVDVNGNTNCVTIRIDEQMQFFRLRIR
jgi:hypothetical protein